MHQIQFGNDCILEVDSNGVIQGLTSEGTGSVVLLARNITGQSVPLKQLPPKAIRIPRLLKLDELANFQLAEMSRQEAIQAQYLGNANAGVKGADRKIPLNLKDPNLEIPLTSETNTQENNCYLGFFFSPKEPYKVILVSNNKVWPETPYPFGNRKASEVYAMLTENFRKDKMNGEDNFYFIPYIASAKTGSGAGGDGFLKLNRQEITNIYRLRNTAGWWFNLPVTVHPWMYADLERLLTDLSDSPLISWSLSQWFDLCSTLADGLKVIHKYGYIHGDTRPANIMCATKDYSPKNFNWIDVGVGGSDSSNVPPPLGAGRESPFYAPERQEYLEFEDADIARLRQDGEEIKLDFRWWKIRIPEEKPEILKFASRELAQLRPKDRIQLREYLFEVDKVNHAENSVTVKRIYEMISETVINEKITDEDKQELIALMAEGVPISRYRIYKHWGQATDIYGYGCILIYLFFMRGLFLTRQRNRFSEKDKMFSSILNMLNSSTFLLSYVDALDEVCKSVNSNYNDPETPVDALDVLISFRLADNSGQNEKLTDKHTRIYREISNLMDYLLSIDSGFITLLAGLNNHRILCIILLTFALKCIWRKEDIMNLSLPPERINKVVDLLKCYCDERNYIDFDGDLGEPVSGNHSKAAEKVHKNMDAISHFVISNEKTLDQITSSVAEPSLSKDAAADEAAEHGFAGRVIVLTKRLREAHDALKKYEEEKTRLDSESQIENQRLATEITDIVQKNERLITQNDDCQKQIEQLKNTLDHVKGIIQAYEGGWNWGSNKSQSLKDKILAALG